MRIWKRNRATESVAEFDARIFKSRASFIEHYNARFDFEAGLDEVYARANLPRPDGLGALKHPRRLTKAAPTTACCSKSAITST